MIPIVIVGHVDHGKSTFIGRLLYDTGSLTQERYQEIVRISRETGKKMEFSHVTDQFQEERDANITIDTSQIFFMWNKKSYVLIDAPGHKEYLKNMITGATQAHSAFVMVDVREGIQEQTSKHLKILDLLGIENIAFLINKMDLVNFDQNQFENLQKDLGALPRLRKIKNIVCVPLSAYNGDNIVDRSKKMPWYKGPLVTDFLATCDTGDTTLRGISVRIPVQHVHTKDSTLWILGRVEDGSLQLGQDIKIFPTEKTAKVHKIQKWPTDLSKAESGESIAFQLKPDVPIRRGQIVIARDESILPLKRITCQIFWAALFPLAKGDTLNIECRTQSAIGTVEDLSDVFNGETQDKLQNGDLAMATIHVKEPLLLDKTLNSPFSRFVLQKDKQTVGCGVIKSCLFLACFLATNSHEAYAYVDPGTGFAFVSGLGGFLLGLIALVFGTLVLTFKKWFSFIKKIFKK